MNKKIIISSLILSGLAFSVTSSAAEPVSQGQESMTIPAPTTPIAKTFREQDFDAVIDATIPLEPDEIRKLHRILDDQKRAAAEPVRETLPRSRQLMVDIAPGAEMHTISVNKGMVSTLVFLDRHGEPWPISSIRNGNSRDYTIEEVLINNNNGEAPEDGTSNALTISTNSYSKGNVAIFLQGLSTPVVIGIKSGDKYTDYRVDLRLNRTGPISSQAIATTRNNAGSLPEYDDLLLSVLGGVAPKHFKFKVLEGYLGDVFYDDKRMFVRTGNKIISPLSKRMIKSADGTIVYEIPNTTVVLMLVDGSVKRVRVK